MCPVQKSPDDLAKKVAGAIVGLRPSDDRFHNLVDNAVQTYPGLGPEEFAGKVGAAARRTVMLRLILGGVVGLLLCIAVIAAIVVWVAPRLPQPFVSTPTLTIVPTSPSVSWVFRGHMYRGQTQQGLEGVLVYLDIYDGTQWHEAVLSATTDVSGSFTLTLPTQWEAKQEYRIRITPPWNVIRVREANGWIWDNTTLQESHSISISIKGEFLRANDVGPVEIGLSIRRVFTGVLYFQGEGAPSAAVIELLDLSNNLHFTRSVTRPADPITLTSPLPIPFELEHDSIDANDQYQIRVIEPVGEWAASVLSGAGTAEPGGLTVIPGSRTVITDIVFAGPFPITLTYKMATWDGWSGLDTSGVITREQPEQPRNARAYWPVYLPGGSDYEIWVGIPEGNSAVISYTLHWDDNGQPGDVVSNGQINPITQCGQINEWQPGAVYPLQSIGAGGLFWIVVDEGQAYRSEDCANIPFQMQVWKIEVRRKK
jgi:hypothetical protein